MAQQCFCGCARTLRFTKGRASSFGRSIAERVDELIAARELLPEDYAPILAEVVAVGQGLARGWQRVAHGECSITGADRLETDAFMQDSKTLLDFSLLEPDEQAAVDRSILAGGDFDGVAHQLKRKR